MNAIQPSMVAGLQMMQGVQQHHDGTLYRVGYDNEGTKYYVEATQCVNAEITDGTFVSHTKHARCSSQLESAPTIPITEPKGWGKDRFYQ